MEEKDIRKQIGDERYDEILAHAKQLKAQGKSPEEIKKVLKAKLSDLIVDPMAIFFVVI